MSKSTIYLQACNTVKGFKAIGEDFIRKLVINGKAKSTHENYLRQMSKLVLHYKRSPLEISTNELEEYLYLLIQRDTDSQSSFKHLVYGLRKLYLLFEKEELQLVLPTINRKKKLPVVLSIQEVKRLLKAPRCLANRVILGFIYDTGLRIDEFCNLLILDVDFDRKQVHIRKTKHKKERYVCLSEHLVRGLKKHMALNNPSVYLFESSKRKGMPIGKTKIRNILKEAITNAGIKKQVCVHTLRHTYATHQLEAGQNIMSVRDAMGHADIQATLLYLHIAQLDTVKKFGCLEMLYKKDNEQSK